MGRFVRVVGFAAVLFVAVLGPREQDASAKGGCIPADKCCKVCDEGQACGNSCISRAKTCHKGRGCSCDATEICAQ